MTVDQGGLAKAGSPAQDQGRTMQWRPLPGEYSRRSRWIRRTTFLGGIAIIAGAIVAAVQFSQTPAIYLQYGPPGHQPTPYEQTHTVSAPQPPGPRTGLWIEIPAIGVALPIKEGDGSNNIPDWVALHYPGTADPGSAGNSYVYAHGIWGMFGELLYATDGQVVVLHNYATHTSQTFHITRVVGKVAWNDTSWIHTASTTPMLTLQTCVGADLHSDRWIVEAT